MKILFPIAAVAILCACTRTAPKNEQEPVYPPHNRTIENPVYGAKSVATHKTKIDKIEIADTLMQLYISNLGFYKLSSESYIVADGQKLKLLSTDTIDIYSGAPTAQQNDESGIQYILNFQDVDSTVQAIDFIDTDIKFWNIALNDYAAARIKSETEVPDDVVREARTVSNDTTGLEEQGFMDGCATVIGKIYGYHPQALGKNYGEYRIIILTGGLMINIDYYNSLIADDGSFEVTIPVGQKYQKALVEIGSKTLGEIYISCNDTVRVSIDMKKAIENAYSKTNNLNDDDCDIAFRKATYFTGANTEINNCDYSIIGDFRLVDMYQAHKNEMAGMTPNEYRDYVLGIYQSKLNEVYSANLNSTEASKEPINQKVKELYEMRLRSNALSILREYDRFTWKWEYGKQREKFVPDINYYSAVKDLITDDNKSLFYGYSTIGFAYNVVCESVMGGKHDYNTPEFDVVSKSGEPIVVERRLSKIEKAVNKQLKDVFGITNPLFFDVRVARDYIHKNRMTGEYFHMNDTALAVMRTLSDPYFLQHAENINNGMFDFHDPKSYWQHTPGEPKADSLFVELIKDFEGKVLYINFWCAGTVSLSGSPSDMKSIENELPMDSIVFINICDNKNTPDAVFAKQSETCGNTNYRLNIYMLNVLYDKLEFSGWPNSLIVNKKGQVVKTYKGSSSDGMNIIKAVLLEEAMK